MLNASGYHQPSLEASAQWQVRSTAHSNYEEISNLQFATLSESMQSKIGPVMTVIIVARQGRAYHKPLFLLYITGSGQHIVQIGPSAASVKDCSGNHPF